MPDYQPQVPSTANGGWTHTYFSRHGGSAIPVVAAGGPIAVQMPATGAVPVGTPPYCVVQNPGMPAQHGGLTFNIWNSQLQNNGIAGMVGSEVYPTAIPGLTYRPIKSTNPLYVPGPAMINGVGTTAGGLWGYPGGQRYLVPTQQPYWNGTNFVMAGLTRGEHMADLQNRTDRRPQELVPADTDPGRMYEVQELDGNWTRRSRFTIDSGDIGTVRWYQRADGSFFAKRLPSG